MSVIIFFVILFVLVLVHEFGHYIVAKWSGMRVDEFAIGFPPKLLSFRKGETEYTLNLIPIGGFVRIYGENGEDALSADTPRAFSRRPRILQALVLIAGVTMNILLAWTLYTATYVGGVATAVEENTASPTAKLVVLSVLPGSPAALGGIEAGDRIVEAKSGAEESVLIPSKVSALIAAHGGAPVDITYERANIRYHTTLIPKELNVKDEVSRPRVGFVMGMIEIISYPFPQAVVRAGHDTVTGLWRITEGIGMLAYQSVRGTANFSDVAGPIGIAEHVGDASRFGLDALLNFTAFISLNLAVINLLPLPALDGGRLVVVLIEAIIRRPLNPNAVGRVNLVGFALLLLLMVVVTAHDLIRIFT